MPTSSDATRSHVCTTSTADGEADFYECFNNDLLSAGGGHAYADESRDRLARQLLFHKVLPRARRTAVR